MILLPKGKSERRVEIKSSFRSCLKSSFKGERNAAVGLGVITMMALSKFVAMRYAEEELQQKFAIAIKIGSCR